MRLTLDIDEPSCFHLLMSYYNLWYITKKRPEIRRSASGKGFHIKVHNMSLSEEKINEIRELLGDDETRLKIDRIKVLEPKQVLFTKKKGVIASEWTSELERVL